MIGQDKPSLEELAHHGVKGQKWGVRRKSEAEGGPSLSSVKSRTDHPYASLRSPREQARAERIASGTSRKEAKTEKKVAKAAVKQQTAKEREDFYQAKANNILKVASEDHDSLIALRTQNDAVIVTGKEFINHMASGGLMDIRASDVYATRQTGANGQKTGPYILNPNINQRFVPSSKRK